MLTASGIGSELLVDDRRPTTRKVRFLSGPRHLLRVDHEVSRPLSPALARTLLDRIVAARRPDVVVLADHDKGVLTPGVLRGAIEAARRWGVPILVDPKHPDIGRYEGATAVKANEKEFEALLGQRFASRAEVEAAVRADGQRLVVESGSRGLVVTQGDRGLMVVEPGIEPRLIAARPVEAVDVSGAGDTVIATMALFLAAGVDLAAAASAANLAASLAVTQSGVVAVTTAALAELLVRDIPVVVGVDDLLARVALWRLTGRRVVFTNGCFDLLHAGHLHLLTEAARHGDVLVVAVDDDESVRRLKGAGRPVVGDRECVPGWWASLGDVDAEVLFGNEEPSWR